MTAGMHTASPNNRTMRYLPDRYPFFWDQLRHLSRLAKRNLLWVIVIPCVFFIMSAPMRMIWWLVFRFSRYYLPGNSFDLFGILLIAVPTAGMIAGERERRSLEMLLLTPVSTQSLLVQKLLGAIMPALVWYVIINFQALFQSRWGVMRSGLEPSEDLFLVRLLANLLFLIPGLCCSAAVGLLVSCFASTTRTATIISFIALFLGVIFVNFESGCLTRALDFTGIYPLLRYYLGLYLLQNILVAGICFAVSVRHIERLRHPLPTVEKTVGD